MSRAKPIRAGTRVNHLVVLRDCGYDEKSRCRLYECRCDCGACRICDSSSLRLGRAFSCGCSNRCKGQPAKHGHSPKGKMTATYQSWANMKGRCYRPSASRYAQYGGRGIKVCERWLIFENFLADMGIKPAGATLERLNVDGNYEPGNCMWASWEAQRNNKTTTRYLTKDGTTLSVAQWAAKLGIPHTRLRNRLHRGWSIERALTP